MQLVVKLKSVDNVIVAVEERIGRMSGHICSILHDNDGGIPIEPIELPGDITGATLQLIFHRWCPQHQNDQEYTQEYPPNVIEMRALPEWDEHFFNEIDMSELSAMLNAAEHLKMVKLAHLARRMSRLRTHRLNMANNNAPAMEMDDDEAEDAEGNSRNFPYLHSQAIIEIGQMLR